MTLDEGVRLRVLCETAGIKLGSGQETLLALLENQLAVARALLEIDTSETEPITTFDPRWGERD